MNDIHDISIIGIDLGGTKILAGKVCGENLIETHKVLVPKNGTEQEVLNAIFESIDGVLDTSVRGIGIGVPSVVDTENGIVYDVQNIPSWKEVHLKKILETKYDFPVFVNNDANCFALGEKYFGQAKAYKNFIALIVGTGMAGGVVIDNKLYNGRNCGAGEFGTIPYLDHTFEYYCCGQFFENVYGIDGAMVYQKALKHDEGALAMYREMGSHLGNAIKTILYAYDPEVIILGGSVSKAYSFFKDDLWSSLQDFAYRPVLENLIIDISINPNIAVLGAAALYHNAHLNTHKHSVFST